MAWKIGGLSPEHALVATGIVTGKCGLRDEKE